MNIPFIYGKIADKENFTDRVTEQELLYQSFLSLVNTVIISPRRWGKTSLVNQVVQRFEKDKSIMICQIDIFNCRTEEEFYKAYANAVLRADLMKNHPYYTQQLSQQTWLRTTTTATPEIINQAFLDIIGQLSLLFSNIIDALTPKQISFLTAIANGVTNFSSKEVLTKYQLGTSANIKNLKKVATEKNLIDILPGNKIELQDPPFEYWLKHIYK